MDEYVGYFDVPVNDLIVIQVGQSLKNVPDVWLRASLREIIMLAQFGLEVSLITELGDDVAIAIAGEDIETAEHIGMVQSLQHVYLREEKFLQFLAFEGL